MMKLILILFLATNLFAQTTYYFDSDAADDSSNGLTPATAKKTYLVFNGGTFFSRGDSALFQRGDTFTESDAGAPMRPKNMAEVVVSAWSGTGASGANSVGTKPIIDGEGTAQVVYIGYSGSDAGDNGIKWEYLHFKHSSASGQEYLFTSYANKADSMVIDSCVFDGTGTGTSGELVTFDCDFVTISNCYVFGSGVERHGIYLAGEDNIVEGCTSENFAINGYKTNKGGGASSGMPRRNIFRNNIALNCKIGFNVGDAADTKIYNNVVKNVTGSTGLHIYGFQIEDDVLGDSDTAAIRTNIYSNTVVLKGESGYTMYGIRALEGAGRDSEVKNNIFYFDSEATALSSYYYYEVDSAYLPTMDNNLYYSDGTYNWHDNATNYTSIGDWRTASSGDADSDTGDPTFTTEFTDLALQAGSPAIELGATLGSPYNVDIDGNARPSGSLYDAGAYEYGASPPTTSGLKSFGSSDMSDFGDSDLKGFGD